VDGKRLERVDRRRGKNLDGTSIECAEQSAAEGKAAFNRVRQLIEEVEPGKMQRGCAKWKYSEEAFTGSAKKNTTIGLYEFL